MTALRTPQFRAEASRLDSTAVLALHGEMDVAVKPQVAEHLEHAVAAGPRTLAIDLRGLTFMDSSGVHTMLVADRDCRARGIRLVLIRGGAMIDRLLAMCGLDRYFEMVTGLQDLPADPPTAGPGRQILISL